ncbi:MAG TPA: hypothetical protein VJT71_10225 [Pyrinomonadaceae bacterium]|nr:hypothetical protein [Pyrinomonadaceae bacterium]
MESDWEEKKIQALYSELKSADEQAAPHFGRVWNRAHQGQRRIRAFNPAFVAATALLVCALVSLAVWSRYTQQTQPAVAVNNPPPATVNTPPASVAMTTPISNDQLPPVQKRRNIKPSLQTRLSAQRNTLVVTNQKLTRDAKAITSWQSPTASLLSSPSDDIYSSFPQLNQSATDLKSFLPARSN